MNLVIPPLIFYAVGAVLVLAGTLRALMLGRQHPGREVADDDPGRARSRRRPLIFGVVWIAMGLFLIVSTAGLLRSKAETYDPVVGPGAPAPQPPPSSGPTLRLEPMPEPAKAAPPAAQ
jgi:hypothetical protein